MGGEVEQPRRTAAATENEICFGCAVLALTGLIPRGSLSFDWWNELVT